MPSISSSNKFTALSRYKPIVIPHRTIPETTSSSSSHLSTSSTSSPSTVSKSRVKPIKITPNIIPTTTPRLPSTSNTSSFSIGELAQPVRAMSKSRLKSSQTEETNSLLMDNMSMMVLGGFIAAVGIAAIAIAFTLLNAATLALPGVVLAGIGAALTVMGLFASANRNSQTNPENSLDFSTNPVKP